MTITAPAINIRDFNEDDLGQDDGNFKLPGRAPAMRAVLEYAVQAVGNRPRDHMGRDLKTASWLRDRKMWPFRAMSKSPPNWMVREVSHLPEKSRKSALQHLAVHYLHKAFIAHMAKQDDPDTLPVIDKLWRCWPHGVQVSWRGEGTKSRYDVCRQAHHCPFCLARIVTGLHDRITRGPWRQPAGKLLLRGQVSFSDALLNGDVEELGRAGFRRLCGQVRKTLVGQARCFGATGGLVTFQCSPELIEIPHEDRRQSRPGLRYTFGVLAELPEVTDRFEAFVQSGVTVFGSVYPTLTLAGEQIGTEWLANSGDDPQSLRLSLAGSNVKFRGHQQGGERGLFFLPPWPVATHEQFALHIEVTGRTHLYDAWGSWISALPKEAPQRFVNASQRRGKYKRTLALKQNNDSKKTDAEARCRELLEPVRLALAEQTSLGHRRVGHRRVQAIMKARGIEISDRDARRLVKLLRAEEVGPAVQGAELYQLSPSR
jgi:hypothetical protein